MTTITRDITIASTPTTVFAVLSDLEQLPALSEMTSEVKNTPGRPLQTGDHFDQIVQVAGIDIDSEWEVTEVVTDRLITVEGRSKSNGRASMSERLVPDGDGCRVTLEVDYDPPFGLLGDIADKVVFERRHKDEAEQILVRLKSLREAPAAS